MPETSHWEELYLALLEGKKSEAHRIQRAPTGRAAFHGSWSLTQPYSVLPLRSSPLKLRANNSDAFIPQPRTIYHTKNIPDGQYNHEAEFWKGLPMVVGGHHSPSPLLLCFPPLRLFFYSHRFWIFSVYGKFMKNQKKNQRGDYYGKVF